MDVMHIEERLEDLTKSFSQRTFVYDFLLAYDLPKASIKRLQTGTLNLSKVEGEVLWKKKLFFKEVLQDDLHSTIDALKRDSGALKHNPRFIIVTDYKTLLAVDTKTQDTLDVRIDELFKHYDFFLPWCGIEKTVFAIENPADVKAAERMAKLFDEIKKDNPDNSPEFIHALNVFLSRLLFCFFAEDTGIFLREQFTQALASHTQDDGSDLDSFFLRFFEVLNSSSRKHLPAYLEAFPYVNGGLFRDSFPIPHFTARSRNAIIESGKLNWAAINPDIFGSMIQAVVSPDLRGGLGMHYTSVPNIMKVIEPLFLNELYEELDKACHPEDSIKNKSKYKEDKLKALLGRISHIKVFDPACGSGNFLIIAYKELRKLEMKIFKELETITRQRDFIFSGISLSQFYGIEIDDFAHEIAILSLWLAEHQMNVEFYKEFGQTKPTLPLKDAGRIVCGNATRLDWQDVCPRKKGDETYILGNPPYLGFSIQSKSQKEDISAIFTESQNYGKLDYIACWFVKASLYIEGFNAKYAFVSTNSICQGEQVVLLWPHIFSKNLEIGFAHHSFKWTNNAKKNAGITCIIVGVRNKNNKEAFLYHNGVAQSVKAINAYLTVGAISIVNKRSTPISVVPEMVLGNMPKDGGNLILTTNEKQNLLNNYPEAGPFVRKLLGSDEFINGLDRWCIWISEQEVEDAIKIPPIRDMIKAVELMRQKSPKKATRQYALHAYRFVEIRHKEANAIIIPRVSSERREYIPTGFLEKGIIVTDLVNVIYDAEPWIFGVVTSKMHMAWVNAVCGRLESRIRYSATLCYNTFPFPAISQSQKKMIAESAYNVLSEREKHSEKTLAQLYDPDKMPAELREAHHQLDLAVERCYRSKPFESDEERLEYLFKLYEKMTTKTNSKGK